MTIRNHVFFWAGASTLFLAAVWVLKDMLLPFVAGLAVAYLLGPVVARMIRAGIPRGVAALVILVTFFVALAAMLAVMVPFIYRELIQLAQAMPGYADQAQIWLVPYITWAQENLPVGDLAAFQETLKNNIGSALRFGGTALAGVIGGGKAVAGFAGFVLLTPVVAFFMMAEWVRITQWIDDMIPRHSYDTIRDLLGQIDRKLSGFIRGQILISILLGVVYAIALTLAGLKYGFIIGLVAGLLSIIPLVGSTIGLVVSVGVAWFQSGELGYTGIIAAIFLVGQVVEGNILTPRIMGDSVGLHPLWILFALVAGGSLLGVVGMFLAVPVAAVIGVLGAFAVAQYRASPYYGPPVRPAKAAPDAK